MDKQDFTSRTSDERDFDNTNTDLIAEVTALRQRVNELETQLSDQVDVTQTRHVPLAQGMEGLFAYFVDNVDAHVFIKDISGRYIFINRKTEDVFNLRREDLADRIFTDFDFFDEAEARRIMENDRQVMQSGQATDFEEGLFGDRTYGALKFPLRDSSGEVIGMCGFARDVTRLKEAEAALRASEERYRQLSGAALEGILFHDGEVVLQANRTFARMFGYAPTDDLSGKPIWVFFAPESHALVAEKIRTRNEVPYEALGLHADGSQFPIEMIARVTSHEGRMARVVVMRDVTERKLVEQQRLAFEREKDRASVLQYFISDASHDLRTPLTTIKTSLHLLASLGPTGDPAKHERHLNIMKEQTEQLERLLEHMLQMTRLDTMIAFQFGPVNINQLIEIIFEAQQKNAVRNGLALQFIPGPNVTAIQADIRHLNRALSNIIENAIQYTPSRGRVTLFTLQDGDEVVIQIQDTGIGIEAADMPRIYDRFFRADPARNMGTGGVGLGLSITKKIIEAHQGTIEVESEPGVGSTFSVRLPVGQRLQN